MKNSATDAAARELIDGIEGDYAVCMGVSEQSYRQFCDNALSQNPTMDRHPTERGPWPARILG